MARLTRSLAASALIMLAACASAPVASPQAAFFARLQALCGQAFSGRLVSTDAVDARFAEAPMIMHVRTCQPDEVRIPFHVGDDRSRTWRVTRTSTGLRLKHRHLHEDGTEDAVTDYGGDTTGEGTAARQEFPADEASRALFAAANLPASVQNIWALEVRRGGLFAYELRRPGRHFRVEFDLTRPVPAPPPPWGSR